MKDDACTCPSGPDRQAGAASTVQPHASNADRLSCCSLPEQPSQPPLEPAKAVCPRHVLRSVSFCIDLRARRLASSPPPGPGNASPPPTDSPRASSSTSCTGRGESAGPALPDRATTPTCQTEHRPFQRPALRRHLSVRTAARALRKALAAESVQRAREKAAQQNIALFDGASEQRQPRPDSAWDTGVAAA